MKYFKKIAGDKVYLSPLNPDDYEKYTEWLNNQNITQYLNVHNQMISLVGEREFLENASKKEFSYAIVKKENDELMGSIALENIDYKNGSATLGIFIGEENNLSKGYGSEAIKLLIEFGFKELRLHNIDLGVFEGNERAIKCYKKCGFVEYGRRHEALYRNGKYIDHIYMEIVNK